MARSGCILLQNGMMALIKRVRAGKLYYAVPGGHPEEGETFEAACAREAYEELGIRVRVDQLAAIVFFQGAQQRYYLCTQTGGTFGTGQGEEYHKPAHLLHRGTHEPLWMPLERLGQIALYPRCIADLVLGCAEGGWQGMPRRYGEWEGGYREIEAQGRRGPL